MCICMNEYICNVVWYVMYCVVMCIIYIYTTDFYCSTKVILQSQGLGGFLRFVASFISTSPTNDLREGGGGCVVKPQLPQVQSEFSAIHITIHMVHTHIYIIYVCMYMASHTCM